jgi:hypothetical protein
MAMSLFKHSAAAAEGTHPAHHTLHEVMDDWKHKVSDAIVGHHLALCRACHAELPPEDVAMGVCGDKDSCCCRVHSQRCW